MASVKQRSPPWFRALAFGPPLLFVLVLQAQAAVKAPVLIKFSSQNLGFLV
jgi:hypothetical protein